MDNQKYVYHASSTEGLKRLEPKKSTHGQAWVYATKDIAISALFMGSNFDFINQIGTTNGKTWVYERFKGALEHAYKDKVGVIYKLPAATFMEGKTQWGAEVVSLEKVDIVEEIPVENVLAYLFKLEKVEKIEIYRYPNIPKGEPTDKSDIIQRAVDWTTASGDEYLELTEKYHPDILPIVLNKLKRTKYTPESKKWKGRLENT